MILLRAISTIRKAVGDIINPPPADPLRFANTVAYVPNFHGELIGKKRGSTINERVRITEGGHVEFTDGADAYAGIEIPSTLTDKDIEWLRKVRLDPSNIAYSKAKVYFSMNPSCNKEDMAKASGIAAETAKDVVRGFRKNILTPSPTTDVPLF